MAVQLVVAGTTFDIPGETLSWRNGERLPKKFCAAYDHLKNFGVQGDQCQTSFRVSYMCLIHTAIPVSNYNYSPTPWGRDVNLIRPRQLVEGFWLRKVSDVYDMADGPVAREGLHKD